MPLATKTKTTLLTPDFKQQIENNLKSEITEPEQNKLEQKQPAPAATPIAEGKGKYDDVANLHFSRGKKAEFRAFFSANGVTLVQGVENAVNYIMKEAKAGRLSVSRNGIEKIDG